MSRYLCDNATPQSAQRLASLETCLEPVTISQLEQIGIAPRWSCLEVGTGSGSIVGWPAERVAPPATSW